MGNALGGLANKQDDRKEEKPAGAFGNLGNLGNRFGGDKKDEKPDAKKDEKSGGGFGGLGNRFGGGDKKDEKPAAKKDDSKPGGVLGGLGNRFGGGDKKDDKPAPKKDDKPGGGIGGALGGLGSRLPFGGGDKKDDKPAAKKDDNKPGGVLGGLGNRFGGGDKKDDRPADAKSSPFTSGGVPRPGTPASSSASSTSSGGGILGGKLPFGSGGGAKPGTPPAAPGRTPPAKAGAKGAPLTLAERLRALNPFKADNDAKKSRTSKAPKVDATGLTLDNKLDILGVSMVLGSLILLLSSLSPVKGALTSEVNRVLSEGFGWGAIGVVIVIFAIGVVLILRHFGDDAPVIPRMRLVGAALLFAGMLVAMQFVHSVRYEVGVGQDYLWTVKNVFLAIAWQLGQGGGRIGGEIYFLLISNLSEIGGFLALVLWLTIGLMLTLNMSASDLAIIVISLFRSFGDSLRRRSQRAAAIRAEKAAATAAAAAALPQISVSRPDTGQEALPAGATAALPAPIPAPVVPVTLPVPEPERSIPITMGGRTFTAPMRGGDAVPMETTKPANRPSPGELIAASLAGAAAAVVTPATADPETTPKPVSATPVAEAAKPDAEKGGFGSRLGGLGSRLPFGAKSDDAKKDDKTTVIEQPAASLATDQPTTVGTAKPDAEKSGRFGGLGSRLPFGAKPDDARKDDKATTVEKPAAALAADQPTTATPVAGVAKPDAEKSGRFGGLSSRLPFGAKPDDAKKDDKNASGEKPAVAADRGELARTFGAGTNAPPAASTPARPAAGTSSASPPLSRREQLIAQYSQQDAAAKSAEPPPTAQTAAPTPPPAAKPAEAPFSQPAASTQSPVKPATPLVAAKPEAPSSFARPAASTEAPVKPAAPKPAEPLKPAASRLVPRKTTMMRRPRVWAICSSRARSNASRSDSAKRRKRTRRRPQRPSPPIRLRQMSGRSKCASPSAV